MPKIVLPLAEMSVAEKLELAETLWADLVDHHPDEIPSPEWHGEVLRERQRQLEAGEACFIPFENAVASLRGEAQARRSTPAPVESDPEKMGGTLVFRGTRVPAQTLLDYLMDGYSLDEFLDFFEGVNRADAETFLRFVRVVKVPVKVGEPLSHAHCA